MKCRLRLPHWVSATALLATVHVAGGQTLLSRPSQPRGEFVAEASEAQVRTDILIVYYSQSGNTERLAEVVAEGARGVDGVQILLKSVEDVTRQDLLDAEGLILGSPTYYANIAGPMTRFINDWAFSYGLYFGGKVGGAFATGGGHTGGKEHVVISLLLAMMNNGMMVAGPTHEEGPVKFGYPGASAVAPAPGEGFSEPELSDARLLGDRIARLALRVGG